MNCRLCAKNITGKTGLLLFDHDDNTETRLGRKLNTILSSGSNETVSNYCCKCCSSKVKICFRLLVEIKASDEVIQQVYKDSSTKQNIDMVSQEFNCQECGAHITGIRSFITHHEHHVLNKTVHGAKKDVAVSFNMPMETRQRLFEKPYINTNQTFFSMESAHEVNSPGDVERLHGVDSDEKENNEISGIVYAEDREENIFMPSGSDLGEVDALKNDDLLESCESFSDEESENIDDDLDGDDGDDDDEEHPWENLDSLSNESDFSDDQSVDSFKSDSSYNNLVEIVKGELEKSDPEDEVDGEIDQSSKLLPDENGHYTCDVCNIAFPYKFILSFHLRSDHNAYHEYDVDLREKQFETIENDNELFFKCGRCKNAFHGVDLKNHLAECEENYSQDKTTLCQICGQMCNLKSLDNHMEEHKKSDGWTCELCGKKFKAKRFLKSHLGEHDESKKKMCEICGKKLLPLSFFSHIMKHREKRHVCPYCGKAFTYNHGLRIHMKVHDASKKLDSKPEKKRGKIFCWLCKKDFSCTIALNKHLKTEHNAEGVEQDPRFPCSQCDKKFADMFSLKAHLKLIHELKDEEIARLKSLPVYRYIECNVCNKVFNSENKIRIHMKQDHGLKPFEMEILKKECEKCGKKFASKQNLIHHINGAHLHIKPMTCDICHEKFAKHSSLIYHKLRHSGEKPFQCEFCHKSYRQRNDVIRHLARHVRDKELTLEEASAVNNSPSRLVIKRRIFLKDSSINYRTIVRKNRRKSEAVEMEPILEEEVNEIQEEQMEFNEEEISNMIYVEEIPVEENPGEVHAMNAKPIYDEERNTIILSNPDNVLNSVKCKYIPATLKHLPAVIVKKQEQI